MIAGLQKTVSRVKPRLEAGDDLAQALTADCYRTLVNQQAKPKLGLPQLAINFKATSTSLKLPC